MLCVSLCVDTEPEAVLWCGNVSFQPGRVCVCVFPHVYEAHTHMPREHFTVTTSLPALLLEERVFGVY